MLWLYNEFLNDFTFYQIYGNLTEGILYQSDSNTIYSLNILTEIDDLNDMKEYEIFNFDIKIKDNLIMFNDNSTNNTNTFAFTTDVLETKTKLITNYSTNTTLPIFKYIYKKVKNTKMPNLSIEQYDFFGTINFKIAKINNDNNKLYIKEKNLLTNEFKHYYITNNLT